MVRESVPSPPTVVPEPRKLDDWDGPGASSSLGARFAFLYVCCQYPSSYLKAAKKPPREGVRNVRLCLRENVLDDVLGVCGVSTRVLNSKAGLLTTSKQISRSSAISEVVLLFVIVVIIVVVTASTAQGAQGGQTLLLRGFLRGRTGGGEGGLGGGSAIESSWAAVCGLWYRLRRTAGATSSLILVVSEEGTNSSGDVPTAGLEIFRGLLESQSPVLLQLSRQPSSTYPIGTSTGELAELHDEVVVIRHVC